MIKLYHLFLMSEYILDISKNINITWLITHLDMIYLALVFSCIK